MYNIVELVLCKYYSFRGIGPPRVWYISISVLVWNAIYIYTDEFSKNIYNSTGDEGACEKMVI